MPRGAETVEGISPFSFSSVSALFFRLGFDLQNIGNRLFEVDRIKGYASCFVARG
jgi:hypothetical protein